MGGLVNIAVDLRGYTIIDVIRQNAGSPATYYTFGKFNNNGSMCDSLMLNNLGSNNTFVSFSGTAVATGGSTMMLLPANATRNMDIRVGSISVVSSGGNYNTEVELVGFGI